MIRAPSAIAATTSAQISSSRGRERLAAAGDVVQAARRRAAAKPGQVAVAR